MGTILSSVSGQFAKSILLGTFFPVVLFVIALTAKILPMAGAKPQTLLAEVFPWETDSALVAVTAFALIITVLLYSLNNSLIRLYEGYPWRSSWLGQWRQARQQVQFRIARDVLRRARVLDRQARETGVGNALPADPADLRTSAATIGNAFPDREDLVLPTRLGNAIRAFEVYPRIRYGIQAIPIWPRLAHTLPAEKATAIDDAKSSFDFMLNCSVLAAVTSALVTAVGLADDHPFRLASGVEWAPWTAAFLMLAYLFYLGAINRAEAWGTQVKVAFDLYRFDLLAALGYKTEISGPDVERALWAEISYELIFPNTPNLPKLPYQAGQTMLSVSPLYVAVTFNRKIAWVADKVIRVTVTVQNTGQAREKAESVEVREKVAKGFWVVKDSVKLDGQPAEVAWLNPLTVSIGELDPGKQKELVYDIGIA